MIPRPSGREMPGPTVSNHCRNPSMGCSLQYCSFGRGVLVLVKQACDSIFTALHQEESEPIGGVPSPSEDEVEL